MPKKVHVVTDEELQPVVDAHNWQAKRQAQAKDMTDTLSGFLRNPSAANYKKMEKLMLEYQQFMKGE